MAPGDVVRFRGSKVTIREITHAPSPSGASVVAVLIERARAGSKWVMFNELEPLDAVPEARQATEGEGSFGPRHP